MMKKTIQRCTAVLFTLLLLAASVPCAFAADEKLKINGEASVNVDDIVTFTLNLSETKESAIGFEMRFFYDSEFLQYVDESLVSETFDNLIYNPHIEGKIPMNWTDIYKPVSFSTKKPVFTCQFKVLKGGEASLSYFVTELYNDEMETLTSYKFTYDLNVGDKKLISDGVLPVSEDKDTLYANQGGFINYKDGMGADNSPNADNHDSVVGNQGAVDYSMVESIQEVTRFVDAENQGKNSPTMYFIIAIPILLAVIAAAVVIVVKKSKNK